MAAILHPNRRGISRFDAKTTNRFEAIFPNSFTTDSKLYILSVYLPFRKNVQILNFNFWCSQHLVLLFKSVDVYKKYPQSISQKLSINY